MENTNENQIENTEQTTETIEKKPKKKAVIIGIIIGVIILIAVGLGLYFGTKTPDKTGKKEDKIEKETETETDTEEETDKDTNENVENESKEEDKTDITEDDTQAETTDDTQNNTEEPVVEKTTMYAKSNVNVRSGASTSNSQIGSLTKGQEIVKIGEENGWSKIEFNGGIGYVKSEYLSTEKVEANTQNNQNTNGSGTNNSSTNNGGSNNTTSNNNQGNTGNNTGGSTTGGMYSYGDSVSFERMNKCAAILDGGMASQIVPVDRGQEHVAYWNKKIWIIAGATNGAWMYVNLAGWYADTTNVGSDETRPGYAEISSLVKQCLETIAPEGGTELYNKISALVAQYGADYLVPTQGKISESIPGLYVTLEQGRDGLEIRFWAE